MNITIHGQFFGTSGYASHVRQLTNALYDLHKDVKLDTQLVPNWQNQCNDAELQMIKKPFQEDTFFVDISPPPFWRFNLSRNPKKFAGFVVWEGDKIPEYWLRYIKDDRVDLILVPSNHVKDAIVYTMKEECNSFPGKEPIDYYKYWDKIKIVPHGVNLELFAPPENKMHNEFTFVANKGWSKGLKDRGGIQYLLQAYIEEFSKDEDVLLKLKINPSYNSPNWNFADEVKKLKIKKAKKDYPKIMVNDGFLDYKSMPQAYGGDIFVSPTMGEGFNLPCAEAMACGLPVIASIYGGQAEFITGWKIPGKLVDAYEQPMYEGIKWFKPDINELKKQMRYCFEHQEEVKRAGERACKDIAKYSWSNSAKKLLKEIKAVL